LVRRDAHVSGRWSAIADAPPETWDFRVDDAGAAARIVAASPWWMLDGYWGDRAEIVLDDHHPWSHERFPASRDHDHCAICDAKIGRYGRPDGYRRRDRGHDDATWICPECRERWVVPGSLGFVPGDIESDRHSEERG